MVANYCLLCDVMCRAGGIFVFKVLTFYPAVTLEIQILGCVWRVLGAF